MTCKINADASTGLEISSDTSQTIDIQANDVTKMTIGSTIDIQGNELVLDADADTSITCDTDDRIDFKTSGSDKMHITGTGNVGIGTNSPGGKVHVSGNAIGDLTTANDGAFNLQSSNDFKCTPSGNITMTFSNFAVQSGNVLLVNSGGHTISAHSDTLVTADLLSTVSTAGTYLLSYFSDGTDAYVTNSTIYS